MAFIILQPRIIVYVVKVSMPDDDNADDTFESFTNDELSDEDLDDIEETFASHAMPSSLRKSVAGSESNSDGPYYDTLNLADIMKKISSSPNFHKMPDDFNHTEFLSSLKIAEHSQIDGLSNSEVNLVYDYLSSHDAIARTKLFLSM